MILILLGTQDKPFDRILNAVSKEIKKKNIKDKVIAQIGCTEYKKDDIEVFDYKPKDELLMLIKKADVIITHGGVGTIIECLDMNKKIIAVPRLKKYKEHTNDHQLQIVNEFSNKGYILPLYDEKKLCDVLNEINEFKQKKYKSNNDAFCKSIEDLIDNL